MITNADGKHIFEGDELPWQPRGNRILVKPELPTDKTEAGLIIPEQAQFRGAFGTIVAAGLAALDQMADQGDRIGDRVCYGRYSGVEGGVWEEWDHITKPGKAGCDHSWRSAPCKWDRMQIKACDVCQAERTLEPLLVMDIDDVKANEDVARRMNAGELKIKKDYTASGRTQHVLVDPREPVTQDATNSVGVAFDNFSNLQAQALHNGVPAKKQ